MEQSLKDIFINYTYGVSIKPANYSVRERESSAN